MLLTYYIIFHMGINISLKKKRNCTMSEMIKSFTYLYTWSVLNIIVRRQKSSTSFPKYSTSGQMIDKIVLVSGRLCKILSRELRNAAEWRRGIRCRGGFAGMFLDSRLENARDAGDTRGQGRLWRNQGRGYGRWKSLPASSV